MAQSKVDLKIIAELNAKKEYYTLRIKECDEQIKYFNNKTN